MHSARDIERFTNAVALGLGLQFDESREAFLAQVLERRARQLGSGTDAYLRALEGGPSRAEAAALARQLTVGETYFFRNSEQFRALAEIVLPERLRANAASRTLRLLSAGCASGEEAYSLAIVLHDAIPEPGWEVAVHAVDLNPAALERAARASYTAWSLRETPQELQQQWFRRDGGEFVLNRDVRRNVRFEARNLAADDAGLWRPEAFDVVFCRNVIMYFVPAAARALLVRIAGALRPGGYLFLGHAETLRGISDAFHLCHTHNTFYYRRKEAHEDPPMPPPRLAAAASGGFLPAPDDSWVAVIQAASERVAALAVRPRPDRAPATAAPPRDLAAVFELLRGERFADALAILRSLPAAAGDPDTLLLTASLLVHSSQPEAAEDTCRTLLRVDELNAGAHYVLALCREAAGDRAAAAEHDRIAAYLDPGFAMPRLHLGLLARRVGDRDRARRELAGARLLLQGEDASRVLLFGGGFSRQSLIALCDAALRDCGAGHE